MSTTIFKIKEGLQQGSVISPKLFNILTKGVLKVGKANNDNSIYSTAYADDLMVYVGNKDASIVEKSLQKIVNDIDSYYRDWNLRINPKKCELIIFHKPLRFISPVRRIPIKNFKIMYHNKDTGKSMIIERKYKVKYLGVQLDYLFKFNTHVLTQLQKAINSFKAYHRLFFNINLETRAKVILYMLLIRPIITYAAPIWWNISASVMERLRKFERSCLRVALNKYRTPESDFTKFYSTQTLYNLALIPRIDIFILNLTRNYLAITKNIKNNIVNTFSRIESKSEYSEKSKSGYFPPQYFTYFDKEGLIQDESNIPIIYHMPRHMANKHISYKIEDWTRTDYRVYNTSMSINDLKNLDRSNKKYWWLTADAKNLDDIRQRPKRKRLQICKTKNLMLSK